MEKKIRWLRISYWTAGIADFIVAVLVLIPSRMGVDGYVYPMGLMSAVAFSWGVLLIIADRQPVERRWILPPTILVVALLGFAGLYTGLSGVLPVMRIVPVCIASVTICSILCYSYMNARNIP